MKLDEFLATRHIPFERLHHQPVYTASQVAQSLHVPGREMAKSVLLRTDHGYVLAVLPATHQVDLEEIRQELGEEHVVMASENDMEKLFPDCERGAMPPFGSLYQVKTLVDESLAQDQQIVIEGQNHEEAIRINYQDFEELEHPIKGHFARRR